MARPKWKWLDTFQTNLKMIPRIFWSFFIEALLVPSFREEWGKYQAWSPTQTATVTTLTRRDRQVKGSARKKEKMERRSFLEKYNFFNIYTYKGHPHDHDGCARVKLNVSGRIYETQRRTLSRFPKTLLGDPARRLPFFDPKTDTYYFDRHRDSFEMILYFYQSGGRVTRPLSVEVEIFLAEIIFFDLGEEAILDFREQEGLFMENEDRDLPSNLFQRKIWLLFEYPESSPQSTVVAITSIFAIILSISSFCIETLVDFDYPTTRLVPLNVNVNPSDPSDASATDVSDVFILIETSCVTWFTLEFLGRLISSPKKLVFCLDIMNIIDFIAIFPYFVQLFSSIGSSSSSPPSSSSPSSSPSRMVVGQSSTTVNQVTYLGVLKVIRLVRVFRIFKLSRHHKGLQILGLTLKASLRELGLLIFFLVIGVILFSSAVYFAELDQANSSYPSIPDAFYWGIVTMTTVGYGDVVPKTIFGKIIGSFCAVAGVLTIALPVPVIVSNFNFFYHRATDSRSGGSSSWDNINAHFVRMCPYFPDKDGIHPNAIRKKQMTLDTHQSVNILERLNETTLLTGSAPQNEKEEVEAAAAVNLTQAPAMPLPATQENQNKKNLNN